MRVSSRLVRTLVAILTTKTHIMAPSTIQVIYLYGAIVTHSYGHFVTKNLQIELSEYKIRFLQREWLTSFIYSKKSMKLHHDVREL